MFNIFFGWVNEFYNVSIIDSSRTYLYYGVVNAIQQAINRLKPYAYGVIEESIIYDRMSREGKIMGEYSQEYWGYPKKPDVQTWLSPLIKFISSSNNVNLSQAAENALNRLVVETAGLIVIVAARRVVEQRPGDLVITPGDLESACVDMFQTKEWFIC